MSNVAVTFEDYESSANLSPVPNPDYPEVNTVGLDLPEPGDSLARWTNRYFTDHSPAQDKELASACYLNDDEQKQLVLEIRAAHGNHLAAEAGSADQVFAKTILESLK